VVLICVRAQELNQPGTKRACGFGLGAVGLNRFFKDIQSVEAMAAASQLGRWVR